MKLLIQNLFFCQQSKNRRTVMIMMMMTMTMIVREVEILVSGVRE